MAFPQHTCAYVVGLLLCRLPLIADQDDDSAALEATNWDEWEHSGIIISYFINLWFHHTFCYRPTPVESCNLEMRQAPRGPRKNAFASPAIQNSQVIIVNCNHDEYAYELYITGVWLTPIGLFICEIIFTSASKMRQLFNPVIPESSG